MDRVRNYISFVVWFVGLGYVALWPLAMTSPLLSPGLHLVGAAAALWVIARLVWLAMRRLMRVAQPPAPWRAALRQGVRVLRREPPAPPPPRWVPPRREFGLRRAPR